MNKIHLTLLITLLLIALSSGCSPSIREVNDNVLKLNADIQKNNSRIEKKISTIKEDLDGLRTSLDDKIQKLNTDIQKNDSRIEKEISTIKKDFGSLKSSLSSQIRKLNTDVQANGSQLENETSTIDENIQNLNAAVHEITSKQKPYWIIAVLFLIIASIFFLRYIIIRLGNTLSSELTSSLEKLKNELIKLDTKPVPASDQKLESDNVQLSHDVEPDHSLPIKVCEEIQRMRNRMKHMDQDDQATKVFRKRLESLEEKLNDMGYELVKLEDRPYNEGMTVKARFISNENMKKSEKIITKVIKPQINFKNVLIQTAEVEVSQHAQI